MANAIPDSDSVKISARIPKPLHKRLKQFCLDNDIKEMHAIKDAIENHIKITRRDASKKNV